MRPNELETAVLNYLFRDPELAFVRAKVDFKRVTVTERSMTGAGFLTDFERSDELKIFEDGVSLRWGKVGARLNASKLETGYLVYVDDGYLTAVEGYTYGEDWPNEITSVETYDLDLGTELGSGVT